MAKERKRSEKRERQLFYERMVHEGRGGEWYARIKEYTAQGLGRHVAVRKVMREMGYTDIATERKYAVERDRQKNLTACQAQVAENQREIVEEQKIASFEEAVRSLPVEADPVKELNWVRAHPAMSRQMRAKDKTAEIVITTDDVLTPPHGAAPSQAAVNALQTWVNHPYEFQKQWLAEQKKKTEGDQKQTETDERLSEVEEFLRLIAGEEE